MSILDNYANASPLQVIANNALLPEKLVLLNREDALALAKPAVRHSGALALGRKGRRSKKK